MGLTGEVPHPRERKGRNLLRQAKMKKKRFWLLACSLGIREQPRIRQENPLFANLADEGRQMPPHTPPPAMGEQMFPLSHRHRGFIFGLNPD